uniref:Uncharacterized protein n=1 Tax=Nelumbo nucifera TaxID=4432 RepID=A0A822YR36_NELNU|nr:TPA_asm: hypothetical protein HUJ06_005712 [Nelumbo nucifera]
MEIEGAEPEFPIRIISFCSFALPIIVFTHGWLAFTESFLSRAWSSVVTGLSLLLYFSRVLDKWKTPPVKIFWWEILFLAILRIVDACNVTRFNTSIQLLSFGLQMFCFFWFWLLGLIIYRVSDFEPDGVSKVKEFLSSPGSPLSLEISILSFGNGLATMAGDFLAEGKIILIWKSVVGLLTLLAGGIAFYYASRYQHRIIDPVLFSTWKRRIYKYSLLPILFRCHANYLSSPSIPWPISSRLFYNKKEAGKEAETEWPIKVVSLCFLALPIAILTHGLLVVTRCFFSRGWSFVATGFLVMWYYSIVARKWKIRVKPFWWQFFLLFVAGAVDSGSASNEYLSVKIMVWALSYAVLAVLIARRLVSLCMDGYPPKEPLVLEEDGWLFEALVLSISNGVAAMFAGKFLLKGDIGWKMMGGIPMVAMGVVTFCFASCYYQCIINSIRLPHWLQRHLKISENAESPVAPLPQAGSLLRNEQGNVSDDVRRVG